MPAFGTTSPAKACPACSCVPRGAPIPTVGLGEDWVRDTADEREIAVRLRQLAALGRPAGAAVPHDVARTCGCARSEPCRAATGYVLVPFGRPVSAFERLGYQAVILAIWGMLLIVAAPAAADAVESVVGPVSVERAVPRTLDRAHAVGQPRLAGHSRTSRRPDSAGWPRSATPGGARSRNR